MNVYFKEPLKYIGTIGFVAKFEEKHLKRLRDNQRGNSVTDSRKKQQLEDTSETFIF